VIPEVAPGAQGRLEIAYLAGVLSSRGDPVWLPTVAVVSRAAQPHPSVAIVRLSTLRTARMTASRMMGQGPDCGEGPTAGVVNGFALVCKQGRGRLGITRDGACRVAVVWPADGTTDHPGEYVSEQVGGRDLSLPGSRDDWIEHLISFGDARRGDRPTR
jgi:hypothetical protein